jgi:cell cycle arrest protein BUB3
MNNISPPAEFELNGVPTDGISNVRFGPKGEYLLVSSWDSSVKLYDAIRNQSLLQYNARAAVLDCCFADSFHAASGGLDHQLQYVDLNTRQELILGEHSKPIRAVEYKADSSLIVTGSWDQTIKLWDSRSQNACIGTFNQPGRVFTMALSYNRLIVGTSGRNIWIWDVRKMQEPEQRRESSLKHQTRTIRAFIEGDGYALTSTEGRVAMEYFDPSPNIQNKKYAFKCHRLKNGDIEEVYPINAVAFHPILGTFATGGCDGLVNVWDGKNKKRISQFRKYPTSISALSFNHDGSQLAIASSYTHFAKETPPDLKEQIFIRNIREEEVTPKVRAM